MPGIPIGAPSTVVVADEDDEPEVEAATAPLDPPAVVVIVSLSPLGKVLPSRSLVAAPRRVKGFVNALSKKAPDEAPLEANRFSAVP